MEFIKDRLRQIAQEKGLSMRSFEETCGLGRGNISNMNPDASIGSDKLSKIIDRFPDIDAYWLITGRRKQAKVDDEPVTKSAIDLNFVDPHTQMYLDRIQAQAEEIGALKERLRAYEIPKNSSTMSKPQLETETTTLSPT